MSKVAKTLLAVAAGRGRLLSRVLNREVELTSETIHKLLNKVQFGVANRKPRKAVGRDGKPRKTDLDLFSVLMWLLPREPIVSMPGYKNALPRTERSDERHLTTSERHGKLVGLIAHEELLSLSVLIKDDTVARLSESGTDVSGQYRTFMVVGYDGTWHNGFKGLQWKLTPDEEKIFRHLRLKTEGTDSLSTYLHLGRRVSLFGAPYLCLKATFQRIEDQLSFLRKQVESFEADGLLQGNNSKDVIVEEAGGSKAIIVPRFRVNLDGPKLFGSYRPFARNTDGARRALEQLSMLRRKRQLVHFVIRACEVAFYHHGRAQDYVAPWVKDTSWKTASSYEDKDGEIELAPGLLLSYSTSTTIKRVAGH